MKRSSIIWSAVAESTEGFAKVDGATALAVFSMNSHSGSAEDSAAALHTILGTVKVELV